VLVIDGKIRVCNDEKQESCNDSIGNDEDHEKLLSTKLRRNSAESHAERKCAPGPRLTSCQSSGEIAFSGT
jgi:hypothetical protein